jgi:hypothetical protein
MVQPQQFDFHFSALDILSHGLRMFWQMFGRHPLFWLILAVVLFVSFLNSKQAPTRKRRRRQDY